MLLAVSLLGAPSVAAGDSPGDSEALPVARAPDFELPILSGGTLRLSTFAGRVVLLTFVNPPAARSAGEEWSRDRLAVLDALQKRYGERRLQIIAIDASGLVIGHRCAARVEISGDDMIDAERVTIAQDDSVGSTVARFGVLQLPTTFLIGTDGRIARRWDGPAPAAELEAAVRAALPARVEASR